jgi:peroxiredoxin
MRVDILFPKVISRLRIVDRKCTMIDTQERSGSPTPLRSLSDIRDGILSETKDTTITIYQLWIDWLTGIGVADSALNVGKRAPEFLLPDVDGRLVSSRELLQRGPLVVSFMRGSWCPFCVAEMRAYQSCLAGSEFSGANVVTITPDTGRYPRQMKRKFGLDMVQILSDVSYGLTLGFGLLSPIPPIGQVHLASRRIDLVDRHGSSIPMLPLPATYVVGNSGLITRAFVDPDFTKRDEPHSVLRTIKSCS